MVISKNWHTKQVDYTNAFIREYLKEEVYITPSRGFVLYGVNSTVLRLIKSLYGLRQAPKTFFDKLWSVILEKVFIPSSLDLCIFMKYNMICHVHLDNIFLAVTNK